MTTTRLIAASVLVIAVAASCRGYEDAEPMEQAQSTSAIVSDGSPEAQGLLRFLNDEATTFEVLDDDVPLPSNAAANLVAHRDGSDAVFGTADDDLFDDVNEVLDVPQIGPARLAKLVAYAEAGGFVPQGDDVLGVYDGVSFTVDEAEATLAEEGDDCTETADCESGLLCTGFPNDSSPRIGKCVDTTWLPGQEHSCGQYEPCAENLECSGLTVYGGSGYCRPHWMSGFYETDESVAIPDGDGAGASVDLVVYGLATVPEDIMVTLYIDHPRPADLVVTLYSTNGSSDVLWNHEGSPDYYLPSLGIERDNYVNGRFTLEVVDTVTGEAGQLNGFKMWVSSRFD